MSFEKVQKETSKYLIQNEKVSEELKKENKIVLGHVNYINHAAGFPMYKNTEVKYYSLGEDNYADLIKELKKAKNIYLWSIYNRRRQNVEWYS